MHMVEKRNGDVVEFDIARITEAITKAGLDQKDAHRVAVEVKKECISEYTSPFTIGDIQVAVVSQLGKQGYGDVQNAYLKYSTERDIARYKGTKILDVYKEISTDKHVDMKENANINSDSAMGKMLKIGAELSKEANLHSMPKHLAKFHTSGRGHWHDLDFMDKTTTCCQIDLAKLFKGGFNTGHGSIRPPQRIGSYANQAAIAIQANQNDQHGGQSVPLFDYYLAPGVRKTFVKHFQELLTDALSVIALLESIDEADIQNQLRKLFDSSSFKASVNIERGSVSLPLLADLQKNSIFDSITRLPIFVSNIWNKALERTRRDTYQAMEGFIHNCNTMHSRAGAQVPFSSINYGTDTSRAGRLVTEQILLALEAGMGKGETPIFPQHIFKVKAGVNFNKEDVNYDLFLLSCRVTGKRLFPNYVFLDAPFNAKYYKQGRPETEVATMGCRTRVIGNTADPSNEVVTGRGNIGFASVNLPRIALESKGQPRETFYEELEKAMDVTLEFLLYKYDILSKKRVYNYPFLMGQGVWSGAEKLSSTETIDEVLRQGTLAIGFVGLAECLTALTGFHHGQTGEARDLGLEIVKIMREYCDQRSEELGLNITLLATPAESLAGRFLKLDRKKYGVITGVTDKEYYTNSNHIPVDFDISMYDKLAIEAPYHALCNAGHIAYVEVDGEVSSNPQAVKDVVRMMHSLDVGYGAINHPVDFDPACGYTGVIKDECPNCKRTNFYEEPFESIRRITGYLTGTLNNFNSAKKAEVRDRVRHG